MASRYYKSATDTRTNISGKLNLNIRTPFCMCYMHNTRLPLNLFIDSAIALLGLDSLTAGYIAITIFCDILPYYINIGTSHSITEYL